MKPEACQLIDEIEDSTKIAVTILDDLLQYEKCSGGVLVLDKAPVQVTKLICNTASLFSIQLRSKSITMSVLQNSDVCDDDLLFDVDYGKLTQVLRNLISNAIKFTAIDGHIRIEAVKHERTVVIRVIDSGVGIAPENLKRVFVEIAQFDANQNQDGGGSGIGLWVSQQLVGAHGGSIRVTSAGLGCGCTFEVEIPLTSDALKNAVSKSAITSYSHMLDTLSSWFRRDKTITPAGEVMISVSKGAHMGESNHRGPKSEYPSERASVRVVRRHISSFGISASNSGYFSHRNNSGMITLAPEPPLTAALKSLRKLHCLVCDDSALNRKFQTRLVEVLGLTTEEAEDGLDCLRKVREASINHFQVILIDNNMPNMQGPDAIRVLRGEGFSGIIVGITGNSEKQEIDVFMDAGADDVLVKPVTYEELESCLYGCAVANRGLSADEFTMPLRESRD
jgi:CheY-like chemotaxis protein